MGRVPVFDTECLDWRKVGDKWIKDPGWWKKDKRKPGRKPGKNRGEKER